DGLAKRLFVRQRLFLLAGGIEAKRHLGGECFDHFLGLRGGNLRPWAKRHSLCLTIAGILENKNPRAALTNAKAESGNRVIEKYRVGFSGRQFGLRRGHGAVVEFHLNPLKAEPPKRGARSASRLASWERAGKI